MRLQDLKYLINVENIDTSVIFGNYALTSFLFFWIHLLVEWFGASLYIVSESVFLPLKCKNMSASPTLVDPVNIY